MMYKYRSMDSDELFDRVNFLLSIKPKNAYDEDTYQLFYNMGVQWMRAYMQDVLSGRYDLSELEIPERLKSDEENN